jgi:pimeloyl-ACP methyl ester carboxylesterase
MLELNTLPHRTVTIQNRHGLELFIRLNGTTQSRPHFAIVAHGLSDVHDSPQQRATTIGLIAAGYTVVAYDATNSWGTRSGGAISDATLSGSYEDLIDVVRWARHQPEYSEPFVLAGHSLGGAAALRFTYEQPDKVQHLILVAPVVSGALLAARLPRSIRELWRLVGRLPQPGRRNTTYNYDLLRDSLRYNGLGLAPGITAPTTIIGGENDRIIRGGDLEALTFACTSTTATLVQIRGANHTFLHHEDELIAAVETALHP